MREARGAEADLRDLETVADAEQAVLVGDLKPLERELAVAAVLLGPHDRDAAHERPPWLVAVEHERRVTFARVVAGARDQQEMRRRRRAGDEPLAAVHD